jgi:hypothetical protein
VTNDFLVLALDRESARKNAMSVAWYVGAGVI